MNPLPDSTDPPPAEGSADVPAPPQPGGGGGSGIRFRILALAAVLLLAGGSVYYFFIGRARGPAGGAVAPEGGRRTVVAIMPMSPGSGSGEMAWVGQAVFDFVPLSLENDADLSVLSPQRLQDLAGPALPSAAEAQRDLARRGGAVFFVSGEVTGKPPAAGLKVSWIETATGREQAAWSIDGITPENLGHKLDELCARLREAMKLSAPGPDDPPLASLVPIKEAPTRSFLEASALLRKGDAAGCLKRLEEALALPDFHLAQFLQSDAAARAGKPREAVAASARLSRVTRPLPTRVLLLTKVILALYGSGNPRRAVAPLESFLARFPDEKVPLSWLGTIELLLLHEPQRAEEQLKKAVALDPANLDDLRLLGRASLEAGHATDALAHLDRYLKSRPEDGSARVLRAEALRRAGRPQEALQAAQDVLSRHPDHPEAAGLLGALLLEQHKVREAESVYASLARSKDPAAQAEGELLLGRSALLQGRFNEGIAHYRAVADRAERAGDGARQAQDLLALADVQLSLERAPEALATLAKIHGISGAGVETGFPMINVLVAQKQYDVARKMLEDQIARFKDRVSPAALARLRDSLEGTIALEEGKYAEAMKRIRSSAPEAGKDPPDSEALGRAYLGAGDPARAESVFSKITADSDRFSDPVRYVRCLVYRGEALEKLGKKDEAAKSYREALRWWGTADYPLPVIAQAREGVRRLGG
ncbi:MAG TPA: tetratricopeptide repeat protein [Candidatus Polarisedimenticolia bacterium]|nr:tetratricopeptide repeat protein [Candidatus Polarisedimenticolia bacterium]